MIAIYSLVVVCLIFYFTGNRQAVGFILVALTTNFFGLTSSAPELFDFVVLTNVAGATSILLFFSIVVLRPHLLSLHGIPWVIVFVILLKFCWAIIDSGSLHFDLLMRFVSYGSAFFLLLGHERFTSVNLWRLIIYVVAAQSVLLVVANVFEQALLFHPSTYVNSVGVVADRFGSVSRAAPLVIFILLRYGHRLNFSLPVVIVIVLLVFAGAVATKGRTSLILLVLTLILSVPIKRLLLYGAALLALAAVTVTEDTFVRFADVGATMSNITAAHSGSKGENSIYRIAQFAERAEYLNESKQLMTGIPFGTTNREFDGQFIYVPASGNQLESADNSFTGLLLWFGIPGLVMVIITVVHLIRRYHVTRSLPLSLFICAYVIILASVSGMFSQFSFVILLGSFLPLIERFEE